MTNFHRLRTRLTLINYTSIDIGTVVDELKPVCYNEKILSLYSDTSCVNDSEIAQTMYEILLAIDGSLVIAESGQIRGGKFVLYLFEVNS